MRTLRLVEPAESDIAAILSESVDRFGVESRDRYETLIGTALRDLVEDPKRRGSHDLEGIFHAGWRSYHLRFSRERAREPHGIVRLPRHVLIYAALNDSVTVLRVLHDAMDIARHLPDHSG